MNYPKRMAESETFMWNKSIHEDAQTMTDAEINEKYRAGEQRIVTESNREKIPNFVGALEKPNYMKVRPFYQRRQRWDISRRSKLIESFIMNIPVPPLFLYEKDFNQYEVMDGQQRITSLKSFYAGEFKLSGLEIWPELNGRTYSTLPSQVKHGLDRRSISYIVVLRESTPEEEDAVFLRQTVFERLNTGGVKLEHQEIRNCLFQGDFNNLLSELTRIDQFRDAFGLPRYSEDENEPGAEIKKASMYQKMTDAEIVLRFFALRHAKHYARGMQGFLDLYMARARMFNDSDLDVLRNIYIKTLNLATNIYDNLVFHPYDPKKREWVDRTQKAFYDSVMVGLSEFIEHDNKVVSKRDEIIEATKNLFIDNPPGTFTGRGNTKSDVKERISKFTGMISGILG